MTEAEEAQALVAKMTDTANGEKAATVTRDLLGGLPVLSERATANEQNMLYEITTWVVHEIERPLRAEITELKAMVAELQARGWRGDYQRNLAYTVGQEVRCDGALWTAVAPVAVNEEPGKSKNWMLTIKSPRVPTTGKG